MCDLVVVNMSVLNHKDKVQPNNELDDQTANIIQVLYSIKGHAPDEQFPGINGVLSSNLLFQNYFA